MHDLIEKGLEICADVRRTPCSTVNYIWNKTKQHDLSAGFCVLIEGFGGNLKPARAASTLEPKYPTENHTALRMQPK